MSVMEQIKRSAARWFVLAALASCGPPPPPPDVVARVAGEAIVYSRFADYVEESGIPPAAAPSAGVLSGLFDRFLEEELLGRLAGAEAASAAGRRDALAALLAAETEPVSQAEVEAYYRARSQEFRRPPRVTLHQLLVDERLLAELAAQRLAAGEPFERVASTLVADGAGVTSWTQRELTAGELPSPLAESVFSLPAGGVGPVVAVEEGWVVVQVERRAEAEQISFRAAAPGIRRRLEQAASEAVRQALVEEASRRYDLEVFAWNLPFEYGGRFRSPA